MQKFLNKHKYVILLTLIVICAILTEHVIHKYMRDHNYWRPIYGDVITPGKQITTYDESELTEEEFDKLFYGEDYESEVEK